MDRASALSRRVKVGARVPLIGSFGLPPGRKLVPGQPLVLRGQGSQTGGSLVPHPPALVRGKKGKKP